MTGSLTWVVQNFLVMVECQSFTSFVILDDYFSVHSQCSLTDELRVEPEEYGDEHARNANKKVAFAPVAKPNAPEAGTVGGEPDGSDSDETDDSM